VALKGKTFAAGQRVQGKHLSWLRTRRIGSLNRTPGTGAATVLALASGRDDPSVDYSTEQTTLVVFELKEVEGGTLLSVVESGFDSLTYVAST